MPLSRVFGYWLLISFGVGLKIMEVHCAYRYLVHAGKRSTSFLVEKSSLYMVETRYKRNWQHSSVNSGLVAMLHSGFNLGRRIFQFINTPVTPICTHIPLIYSVMKVSAL